MKLTIKDWKDALRAIGKRIEEKKIIYPSWTVP